MFDDLDDEELDMIDTKEPDEEEEQDKLKRTASKKRTVGEVRICVRWGFFFL